MVAPAEPVPLRRKMMREPSVKQILTTAAATSQALDMSRYVRITQGEYTRNILE